MLLKHKWDVAHQRQNKLSARTLMLTCSILVFLYPSTPSVFHKIALNQYAPFGEIWNGIYHINLTLILFWKWTAKNAYGNGDVYVCPMGSSKYCASENATSAINKPGCTIEHILLWRVRLITVHPIHSRMKSTSIRKNKPIVMSNYQSRL